MTERQNVNFQILEELRKYFEKYPHERFGQGLRNIGVVDTVHNDSGVFFSNEFNTESVATLNKIFETQEER